uniref:NID domain-containing protein n=1 Tax=Eptatretus burgeri TaxID=7764 RepID=A0A8C4QVQ7_EPTBU
MTKVKCFPLINVSSFMHSCSDRRKLKGERMTNEELLQRAKHHQLVSVKMTKAKIWIIKEMRGLEFRICAILIRFEARYLQKYKEESIWTTSIIARKIHFFGVENYTMEIKAFPIALELVQNFEVRSIMRNPFHFEISHVSNILASLFCSLVSKTKILVWDIPNCFSPEQMEDKLELSFCKPSNGGGEVIGVEYTPETSSAVLTFKDEGELPLSPLYDSNCKFAQLKPITLKIAHQVNTYSAMSQRTVLLKDIAEVIAPEDLQDRLEIFFQKESNGGGEVQNIVYKCSLGNSLESLIVRI